MGQLIGSPLNSPFLLVTTPLAAKLPLYLDKITRSLLSSASLKSLQFDVHRSILHHEGFDSCRRIRYALAAIGMFSLFKRMVWKLIFT